MQWDEAAQQHLAQATLDYVKGKTKNIVLQREDLIYYGSWFEIANQFTGQFFWKNLNLSYVDAFHVLIFATAIIGLIFFYILVKQLLGQNTALYGLLFLLFSPRFMAHAHYNSKDIPLAIFSIIGLFCLYLGFVKQKWLFVLLAAVTCGLAVAIRADALLIPTIFFLPYLSWSYWGKKAVFNKQNWSAITKEALSWVIFLLFLGSTVYLLWPALWGKPQLFFEASNYFLRHGWQSNVLYLGKFYAGNQLPWHYAPFYLMATTPLAMLTFSIFGLWDVLKKLKAKKQIMKYGLILSWLFLPILISFKPGIVKYDGVRHYLLIVPALAILAGSGFSKILRKLYHSWPKFRIFTFPVILSITLLSLSYETFLIYPYGDSYFNEVLRTLIPAHIENKLEIEYWGTTYREGVNWLDQNASKNAKICVPVADHLVQFYPLRQDLTFGCGSDSNYLMFFTRYTYLPESIIKYLDNSRNQPIFTISRYNSNLMNIYKL